ncbi:MAG TPA: hypothetical protein VL485_21750 [Ktedonobacteraceae bacterium]|nr:hypothetical protein [Ktedonobacteraceae bacterium]
MSSTIRLFTAETIDSLPWPETADGAYAREYLVPLIQYGPSHFIENVKTCYMALLIEEQFVLPISINQQEYQNSYVCSPYTHYITYAQEELNLIQPPWLRLALAKLIESFGILCKLCHINRVVCVNNWLLSTNLYPDLSTEHIAAIIDFLQQRFPQHAIMFRSLNTVSNPILLNACKQYHCQLIPSRQLYIVHPAHPGSVSSKARWLLKRDLALVKQGGYTPLDAAALTEDDVPRIVELYNALYLQKYSLCNPMFNARFITLALAKKILHLVAVKKDQRMYAILGYFCRNGVMTTPLFGYDTTLPLETGLYRMLSALLFNIAKENGHVLNESSGAAQFKRNRGAVGEIEYSAVYDAHLPLYRRLCWRMLALLLEKIGVPFMKKYKL